MLLRLSQVQRLLCDLELSPGSQDVEERLSGYVGGLLDGDLTGGAARVDLELGGPPEWQNLKAPQGLAHLQNAAAVLLREDHRRVAEEAAGVRRRLELDLLLLPDEGPGDVHARGDRRQHPVRR